MIHTTVLLLLLPWGAVTGEAGGGGGGGFCSVEPSSEGTQPPLYWKVTNPTLAPAHLRDLPGFTRSVYQRDHAIITPESQVFSPLPDWINTLGAYLISPAIGAHFTMYLANMLDGSKSALPPKDVERFVFVVQGSIVLSDESGTSHKLLFLTCKPYLDKYLTNGSSRTLHYWFHQKTKFSRYLELSKLKKGLLF